MELQKKKLLKLLDEIADHQKEISECHHYYQRLEKELDQKRQHLANPEDLSSLMKDIAILNRQYQEKVDLMFEKLNAKLLEGHDLAKNIGHEIAYDFKRLWDYMTDSIHQEVKLDKVLKEIDSIKQDFLF